MEVILNGVPKEIAALVVGLQERQDIESNEKLTGKVLQFIQEQSESGQIFQ